MTLFIIFTPPTHCDSKHLVYPHVIWLPCRNVIDPWQTREIAKILNQTWSTISLGWVGQVLQAKSPGQVLMHIYIPLVKVQKCFLSPFLTSSYSTSPMKKISCILPVFSHYFDHHLVSPGVNPTGKPMIYAHTQCDNVRVYKSWYTGAPEDR